MAAGSRVPSLESRQSRDVCGQCITDVPLRRNPTSGRMARQKWAVGNSRMTWKDGTKGHAWWA